MASHKTLDLQAQIPPDLFRLIRLAGKTADKLSQKTYLVGGLVRDTLARHEIAHSSSPDLTVIGNERRFADAMIQISNDDHAAITSTSQHRTLKARIRDITVEIATARTDLYDPWGSLPQITPTDQIEKDLARRDYTINSMAVSLQQHDFGTLIDPFNGAEDCQKAILRILHDDSFREDPTRIMRGIRLQARYNLTFHPHTYQMLRRDLEPLGKTSPSRVFNEFRLWLKPDEKTERIIQDAVDIGALEYIAPELISAEIRVKSALKRLRYAETDLSRLAILGFAIAHQEHIDTLKRRLPMPARWATVLQDSADLAQTIHTIGDDSLSDSQIAKKLREYSQEAVHAASLILKPKPELEPEPHEPESKAHERVWRYLYETTHIETLSNGDDLIAIGIPKGPAIGIILDEIKDRRIDRLIHSKQDELRYAQNRFRQLQHRESHPHNPDALISDC